MTNQGPNAPTPPSREFLLYIRPRVAACLFTSIALVLGCATTRSAWHRAGRAGTIEAYEEFMRAHPQGLFYDSAWIAVHRLKFAQARATHTVRAYDVFLRGYRGAPPRDLALLAQRHIDDIGYGEAESLKTTRGYVKYLTLHPGGAHEESARAAIELLIRHTEVAAGRPAANAPLRASVPRWLLGTWTCSAESIRFIATQHYLVWSEGDTATEPTVVTPSEYTVDEGKRMVGFDLVTHLPYKTPGVYVSHLYGANGERLGRPRVRRTVTATLVDDRLIFRVPGLAYGGEGSDAGIGALLYTEGSTFTVGSDGVPRLPDREFTFTKSKP